MIRSLSARLLLAVSLLLLVFFGLTIFLLDVSFRTAAERASHDRLKVPPITRLAAADVDDSGHVTMPDALPEARFSNPESGLFGQITTPAGERLWRSPSLVGRNLGAAPTLARGQTYFERTKTKEGEPVFASTMLVDFDVGGATTAPLVFTVAESMLPFQEEVARFRGQLFGWFAVLTAVLLGAQALLMRLLLKPLRRVEREIVEIEDGAR